MNLKQATTSENSVEQISMSAEGSSQKVNINNLISRYKKEKAKEKTETFIFVGLACALIIVSGIIVSL